VHKVHIYNANALHNHPGKLF